MNPDASADWASAILGLHQLLSDHLEKAQPGVPPVRLPELTDWLQTMVRAAPSGLAAPPGLEGLPANVERDALWESAAQRYRSAASALHAAWLEIGSDTLDTLRQELGGKSAPQNLRETYDLWVACGESAVARPVALKDELARAQAREARLRTDLEALRQADTVETPSSKKRAARKKAQPASKRRRPKT